MSKNWVKVAPSGGDISKRSNVTAWHTSDLDSAGQKPLESPKKPCPDSEARFPAIPPD